MIHLPSNFEAKTRSAVSTFWKVRETQAHRQTSKGKRDQGTRGAATGGAQMDGFIRLLEELIEIAGVSRGSIFTRKRLFQLPGFFRPTKEWDLLVVDDGRLIAAIETKSQVGPSFGNNFNNRTEEAMGSALDLWTAYRERAYGATPKPWLGYLFLLEDCPKSRSPVKVREPHFDVFPEYQRASYAKRYELFCRRLALERHYDATTLILSDAKAGTRGRFSHPADDVTFNHFAKSLMAHVGVYSK